jgi:hypothetical protein
MAESKNPKSSKTSAPAQVSERKELDEDATSAETLRDIEMEEVVEDSSTTSNGAPSPDGVFDDSGSDRTEGTDSDRPM